MAEIKSGKETTIEIVKEKMGLGLSIVGGSDTLLVSLFYELFNLLFELFSIHYSVHYIAFLAFLIYCWLLEVVLSWSVKVPVSKSMSRANIVSNVIIIECSIYCRYLS